MIETTTRSKLEVFKDMLAFQERIFHNVFKGLTDKVAIQRPHHQGNHSNWLVGHIVHCRYMLASMLGMEVAQPFGQLYWEPVSTEKKYPGLEEIKSNFDGISKGLSAQLDGMSDRELLNTQKGQPALKEIIPFFIYHEAYHLGQLGYVRKWIGLEPLISN